MTALLADRLRYLLAPLATGRMPVFEVAGTTHQGVAERMLFVGARVKFVLLLDELLAPGWTMRPGGSTTLPGLRHRLAAALSNHEFVIARLPRAGADLLAGSTFLRMPEHVGVWVETETAWRRSTRSSGTIASARQRFRRLGLAVEEDASDTAFASFVDEHYAPFVRARFGEGGSLLPRDVLRKRLASGTIVWLVRDGRRVAGSLVGWQDDTLLMHVTGTSVSLAEWRRDNLHSASRFAALELAHRRRLGRIDFGSTRPFLTDGILQSKRFWGGRLRPARTSNRSLLVGWNRASSLADTFLGLAPIIVDPAAPSGPFAAALSPSGRRKRIELIADLGRLYVADSAEPGVSHPDITRLTMDSSGNLVTAARGC